MTVHDVPEDPAAPPPGDGAASAPPAEIAGDANTDHQLDRILEALLLAADQPLSLDQLARLLAPEWSLSRSELRAALAALAERLADSATLLSEVASGWRLQVRSEYAGWVSRLWQEKPPKLSRAALETLALVVYRQPITRGEIEDIRGVAVSSNILRGLLERGWIREIGHKEVPGRPALFGTTAQFLDDFGVKSLDQLPALPEVKDQQQLEAALARLMPADAALPDDDAAEAPEQAAPAIEDQTIEGRATEGRATEDQTTEDQEPPPDDEHAAQT